MVVFPMITKFYYEIKTSGSLSQKSFLFSEVKIRIILWKYLNQKAIEFYDVIHKAGRI
jgi:hypothetical protein